MGNKDHYNYYSLILALVATVCSILSLTGFELDIPQFYNSLEATGKMYFLWVTSLILILPVIVYFNNKICNLESCIGNLSNRIIRTEEVIKNLNNDEEIKKFRASLEEIFKKK